MMFQLKKTQVNTDKAPAAIGPYSQAVIAGPFVFTSGQLTVDPKTNELVGGDAANQASRFLRTSRQSSPRREQTVEAVKQPCFSRT